MVCYLHDRRPVVVSCSGCKQALCRDCAQIHRPPLCGDCLVEAYAGEQRAILRRGSLALGLGIAFAVVMNVALYALYRTHVPHAIPVLPYVRATVLSFGLLLVLLAALIGLGAPYGYRVFGAVKYPRGYFIPISMFVPLIEFRVFAGLLIGPFIFPFSVMRDIYRYRANAHVVTGATATLRSYRAPSIDLLAASRGQRAFPLNNSKEKS